MAEPLDLVSTILEWGLSSEQELEEALARQLIYGGELPEHLHELGLIPDADLKRVIAHTLHLPPAPSDLPPLDVERTTRALHTGHRVVVRTQTETQQVFVLTRTPLSPQELTSLLTQVWPEQQPTNVEQEYELPWRIEALLSLCETAPAAQADSAQAPVAASAVPPSVWSEETQTEGVTAPPPLHYEEITAITREEAPPPTQVLPAERPAQEKRHWHTVQEALQRARDRDAVVQEILVAARPLFEYVALFAISGTEARGLRAEGPGTPSSDLAELRIPLDLPSALAQAVETGAHQLVRLRASGLEGGIVQDLARPSGRRVLLLPFLVRGRTVLLLWGDAGDRDVQLDHVGDLIAIGPLVASAIERVVIRRKRESMLPTRAEDLAPLIPPVAPQDSQPIPLASASPVASANTPASSPPLQASSHSATPRSAGAPSEPVTQEAPPPPFSQKDLTERDTSPRRPAVTDRAQHLTSTEPSEPAAPESSAETPLTQVSPQRRTLDPEPRFPSEPPRTLPGLPEPHAAEDPEPQTSSRRTASRLMTPRRIVKVDTSRHAPLPLPTRETPFPREASAQFEAPLPRLSTATPLPSKTWGSLRPLPDEPPEEGWGDTRPGAASPPALTHSYEAHVERLLQGDEGALSALLAGEQKAVAALIAVFPGPVTEPATPTSPASSCGPVLHALQQLGKSAIPFLTVRTADENPQVRRWATFLLGELPSRDSARAIAGRLLDSAVEVRRAALLSARRIQAEPLARRTLLSQMEELALDEKLELDTRTATLEAWADMRESEAIPTLLQLLQHPSSALARSAQWALSVLTRQDFGTDSLAWRNFWQKHRDEPRTEWLILALDHEKTELRRAAIEELSALTGTDFGYHESLPSEERREIQTLIRTWWARHKQSELSSSSH